MTECTMIMFFSGKGVICYALLSLYDIIITLFCFTLWTLKIDLAPANGFGKLKCV